MLPCPTSDYLVMLQMIDLYLFGMHAPSTLGVTFQQGSEALCGGRLRAVGVGTGMREGARRHVSVCVWRSLHALPQSTR